MGSKVDFYDPAVKLKTQRLSGIVTEVSDGGTMAQLKEENSKRHIRMKCDLLRHRGEYNEVSLTGLRKRFVTRVCCLGCEKHGLSVFA